MPAFPPPDILAARDNPTVSSMYGPYKTISTSDAWKAACASLPSCLAVAWPGYATAVVPTTINDIPVIIQPWLGHCQQFLGRGNFPGGFGGEVGVYVRVPRERPLPDLSLLPEPVQPIFRAVQAFGGDHLWWPDPDCQFEIEFTIINPKTSQPMLTAKSDGPTYWLNRWLEPDAYEQYVRDVDGQVPFVASAYQMVYTVAGQKFGWGGVGLPA
jgi:hypothetical protein